MIKTTTKTRATKIIHAIKHKKKQPHKTRAA